MTSACRLVRGARVEQPGDRAQQVAGTGVGRDVQVDLVEVHDQAEQVEVERPEHQVEDLAGRGGDADRDGDRLRDGADLLTGGVRHGQVGDTVGEGLASSVVKPVGVKVPAAVPVPPDTSVKCR